MANGCSYVYKYGPGEGQACGKEVWADGLCIGHHPGPKDEAAFRQAVDAKLEANDWDFQEWTFPWDLDFSNKTLTGANFASTTFEGEVLFTNSTFQRGAHFWGANFRRRADFTGATFREEPVFISVIFEREASFVGAIFEQYAWFWHATFRGHAEFERATFRGLINFSAAIFEQEAHFEDVNPHAGMLFQRTTFRERTSFGRATLAGATFQAITRSQDPPRSLERVSFREATGLEQAVFEDVDWGRWKGREFVTRDELDARETGKSEDYAAAEAVYRGLRRSYETRKDFMRANELYYGEMEMRREQMGREAQPTPAQGSSGEGQSPYQKLKAWLLNAWGALRRNLLSLPALYWLLAGYGTRWRRALAWYLALLLLSTLGYAAVGYELDTPGAAPASVTMERLLAHSFRTTLVQREPELRPRYGTGTILEIVETALGPIILFLTGLAVRRRFQR